MPLRGVEVPGAGRGHRRDAFDGCQVPDARPVLARMLDDVRVERRGLLPPAEDRERLHAEQEHRAGTEPHRLARRRDLDPLTRPQLHDPGLVAFVCQQPHERGALPTREHRSRRLPAYGLLELSPRVLPIPSKERGEAEPHIRLRDPWKLVGGGDLSIFFRSLDDGSDVPRAHVL
jgi:hypothetical protein